MNKRNIYDRRWDVRNWDDYFKGLWNLRLFKGCLGGNVKPTDVDALIERNGHFLLFEGKSPNSPIPEGQRILFDALLAKGSFTILIGWADLDGDGLPARTDQIQVWPDEPKTPADYEDIQKFVKWWWLTVEAGQDPAALLAKKREKGN